MSPVDFLVLVGTVVGIAAYGVWRTRGRRGVGRYLKGDQSTGWFVIGVSVMATQASAITFISTPEPGVSGWRPRIRAELIFGAPLALILILSEGLPADVPANERLYRVTESFWVARFDAKVEGSSGAALFLLQRGLAAGITIYAPAIILSHGAGLAVRPAPSRLTRPAGHDLHRGSAGVRP